MDAMGTWMIVYMITGIQSCIKVCCLFAVAVVVVVVVVVAAAAAVATSPAMRGVLNGRREEWRVTDSVVT